MALECAIRCNTCATRDIDTVAFRFEHEGLSFLTITLPELGKSLERAIDEGQAGRNLFSGFQRKGELPRFLGGFLDRVFDRGSGRLLDDPCIDAIRSLRQLTLMFGKVSVPCSDARVRKALHGYIQCEQEVRESDAALSPIDLETFHRISSMLFGSVFAAVDSRVYYGDLIPKHGPGSTADKLLGNKKFLQRTWTHRLEKYFPMESYLLPNNRYYDMLEAVNLLEPGAEIPAKVITVPKTLKTPRIIAMEPTAMQYAQQAIYSGLLEEMFKNRRGQSVSGSTLYHLVGFDDQVPNQQLAREGSITGSLATLDLSEASDRVSNQLVRKMLSNHPHLHGAVDACRSRRADVLGYGISERIRLAKFASMGSALCFPIEAMVFLTVVFIGIEQKLNRPLCPQDVKHLRNRVRVYGDDIIVPVDYVLSVVAALETFGFRVNRHKSFWNGQFRESCGKEYFRGEDISIVRVRDLFPTRRQDVAGVESIVSLRNQLYLAGYWRTTAWLDQRIRKVLKYFPVVADTSPVLGRVSFLGYETQRLSPMTHGPQVKGYVKSAPLPRNSLSGEGALLKYFLKRGSLPFADMKHLERSGRPKSVNLRLGWWSSY